MSQPVWTCKCCSVIFAEKVDFESHRKECIKKGKACPRCSELFTQVGLDFHLNKSICGLRKYDVKDLHTWATEVNDRRITVLVKDYHKKIMDAVEDGKFSIRLTFIYPVMYPDDSLLVRTDALSRIVSELKNLFTNVNITSNLIQNFIDVTWIKPKSWFESSYGDIPEKFLTLPELVETDAVKERTDTIKKQMSELSGKFTTGFKNVTSILGKARKGKSELIDAYIKESQGDSSTIIFTVPVGDEKEEQQEEQEDNYS
jgi:hypothetical protein